MDSQASPVPESTVFPTRARNTQRWGTSPNSRGKRTFAAVGGLGSGLTRPDRRNSLENVGT